MNKKIVVIGGGTGLATMLRGLKLEADNITAIVTVSDDGGGSGILRSGIGMLPPGDIRNCITALAQTEPIMSELLNYRFTDGDLKGQSFGNLFLAALTGVCGSFEEAVAKMNKVLSVKGQVLPVTNSDIHLMAKFENGTSVCGESKIADAKKLQNCRISEVSLVPANSKALPSVIDAINDADVIILGPGSLYTSIIPNLLVVGVSEAIEKSKALKIYISNIMTQDGETEHYTAFDHIKSIRKHSFDNIIDICIYNTEHISKGFLDKYKMEDAGPVIIDEINFKNAGIKLIGKSLIARDTMYARHDPKRLADAIISVINGEK